MSEAVAEAQWPPMAGAYYATPQVALYHGDCREWLSCLEAQVDHVITDPPYEVEAHTKRKRLAGKAAGGKRAVVDQHLDFAPMTPALREAVSSQIERLTRRWALVFCQVEASHLWREELCEDSELEYIRTGIWWKPDAQPQKTGDRPGVGYETFVIAHRTGRKRWNGRGKCARWTHPSARAEGTGAWHQTPKPEALMRELVVDFTDPGDVILDPFAGRGTTLVGALVEGRRAIGIELREQDCEAAAKRLERAAQQLPLWTPRTIRRRTARIDFGAPA